MPETIVTEAPTDARITGLPPEAPRLTLGDFSDDEERNFMRAVLRHYVWQFGPEAVIDAVKQIAAGAR